MRTKESAQKPWGPQRQVLVAGVKRPVAASFALAGCATIALLATYASAQTPAPKPTEAVQSTPASPAQSAQDISGIWQGTLHIPQANRDLRIVNKISKNDKGELKVLDYSIDQGGMALPASKASFEGGVFKYSIEQIGGAYQGTISPDGQTITGTWTQGPNPLPLNLARTSPDAAWPIPEPPKPMAADADPSFEVATIKPNDSGATQMRGLTIQGREFRTNASSLQDLIAFAYNMQAKQIVDGQPWMSSDRYDILAVPDTPGVPNPEQVRVMIRKLLADRFKLTFHHEQREMSAYVLEVAKTGEKLTPTVIKGNLPGIGFRPGNDGLTMRAMNASMADFTGFLQVIVLDRPVVDRTNLAGKYDLKCTFTPDDSQFNGHPPRLPAPSSNAGGTTGGVDGAPSATDTAAAPSLFEAMQQQLGLKLTAQKTGVDVLVIDHVEKPSAN